MIKANELRIGNIVYYIYPEEDAGGNIIGHREEFTITSKYIQHAEDHPDMYHSIPLTEEWLERMGFKQGGIRDYVIDMPNNNCLEWERADNSFSFCGVCLPYNPVYVHQLQNLYFALTGEELTVKEHA